MRRHWRGFGQFCDILDKFLKKSTTQLIFHKQEDVVPNRVTIDVVRVVFTVYVSEIFSDHRRVNSVTFDDPRAAIRSDLLSDYGRGVMAGLCAHVAGLVSVRCSRIFNGPTRREEYRFEIEVRVEAVGPRVNTMAQILKSFPAW